MDIKINGKSEGIKNLAEYIKNDISKILASDIAKQSGVLELVCPVHNQMPKFTSNLNSNFKRFEMKFDACCENLLAMIDNKLKNNDENQ